MSKESKKESKIVSAVGVATAVGMRGESRALAQRIQAAMSQAILDANAEGISTSEEHSVELRARMLAARQRVLDEVRAGGA